MGAARAMIGRRAGGAAWETVAVAVLVGVAAMLRLHRLELGWFGVDQARDVATALDITAGRDFPLVGPTMRRVTRLGALYHYFWALPYLAWRDPIAGYWFAAGLGVVALVLVWWLARRLWGPGPALVALALGAAHPVWVIDARVLWAPAALPFAAASVLALALGRRPPVARPRAGVAGLALSPARAALVGGALGVALQLHLSMLAWVVAAGVVVLLERPAPRCLAAGVVGFGVAALPALFAALHAEPGGAGGAALASTAPGLAGTGRRLGAVFELPVRVPLAFGATGSGALGGRVPIGAGVVLSTLALGGLVRLFAQSLRGDARARALVIVTLVALAMVAGLPHEAWYYYLDGLLPLWALAAGAAVAPIGRGGGGLLRRVAASVALVAAAVLAVHMLGWIHHTARTGYIALDPTLLNLDRRPRPDAAVPGRLLTLAVKREVAAVWAASSDDAEALWLRAHGPAFADATGDNGFWLRTQVAARGPGGEDGAARRHADRRHLALWHRDHPTAVALAAAARRAGTVETVTIGPLLLVRYRPRIDYASCRADGLAVTVPIRVVPHPKRYGSGAPEVPRLLPAAFECEVVPGDHPVQVVASLGGEGTVRVTASGGAAGRTADASTVCVEPAATRTLVRVEITTGVDRGGELDLYDVPLGVGCVE